MDAVKSTSAADTTFTLVPGDVRSVVTIHSVVQLVRADVAGVRHSVLVLRRSLKVMIIWFVWLVMEAIKVRVSASFLRL